jgi:ABC-type transporter Mla MlaB component
VKELEKTYLSALFCVARSLDKNDKKFKVTEANERIKNLFKLINFDIFLEKYDADNKINE